jgi:hypothetical protein
VAREPHSVCYPGKSPKRVRLEETSNPRLESECIITNASSRLIIFLLLQHVFLMLRLKIEHNCRIRGVFYPFKKKSGNKFFLLCKSP